MKKSWMLFLIVFLTGAVNEIKAVRGHEANREQDRARLENQSRCHFMSFEDENKCTIVEESIVYCCLLIPRYRTRRLASLPEGIKVGDNLRYLNPSHGIDGYSTIERHYVPDMYEYWKIVDIDTRKKRFKESFVNDRCLTRYEENTEAI